MSAANLYTSPDPANNSPLFYMRLARKARRSYPANNEKLSRFRDHAYHGTHPLLLTFAIHLSNHYHLN
jgi:hypothetical protein